MPPSLPSPSSECCGGELPEGSRAAYQRIIKTCEGELAQAVKQNEEQRAELDSLRSQNESLIRKSVDDLWEITRLKSVLKAETEREKEAAAVIATAPEKRMEAHAVRLQGEVDELRAKLKEHGIEVSA